MFKVLGIFAYPILNSSQEHYEFDISSHFYEKSEAQRLVICLRIPSSLGLEFEYRLV